MYIAKRHLGVSKGRLNIRKETWYWKEESTKLAVCDKKIAFKAWKMCDRGEKKQELRSIYKEKKKLAKRAVARSKAEAYKQFYINLETTEGQKELYKIAAQRRNNAKDILSPKFIEDEKGKLLTQDNDICVRWKNYFHKFLNEEFPRKSPPIAHPIASADIRDFPVEEIEKAISQMQSGKAVGPDEIPTDLWKQCSETSAVFLCILFNKIKNGNQMPEAFRESFLLPFFKGKGDSRACGNYRGIKLICHTLKVWERAVINRISNVVQPPLHPNQCGFVAGKSTSDAIQAMRILIEKHREARKDLHVIFIDLEKAFDRVPRDLIWAALRYHSIPEPYVAIIQDMYANTTTKIRCTAGQSTAFPVNVGVHQGSVASPLLFILVMNFLTSGHMNDLLEILLFADDIALVGDDVTALQDSFDKWRKTLEDNGLRISRSKTEVMSCMFHDTQAPTPDIMLDSVPLPKCTSFKYLGSVVNQQGDCDQDVNHRVSVGWLKWQQNTPLFCDKRMPVKLKGKLYSTVVRPALTYGAKCWTLNSSNLQRMNTTEMKMLRMSAGVTRKDRIRNTHIRGTLHVKEAIGDKIVRERAAWFEKQNRNGPENVVSRALDISIAAQRRQGRPKNSWVQQMKRHQNLYGLNDAEKAERNSRRNTLRSANADPRGDV